MSAALQLPLVSEPGISPLIEPHYRGNPASRPVRHGKPAPPAESAEPEVSLAFYRKHTESLLRRYLYASMLVGRTPSMLGDPVARGWASSRPVRTFEDALIFVLDIEKCLDHLAPLDRKMICRIVLQEYTQVEAAPMLGMGARTLSYKFPMALDRLTRNLLDAGLLVLPQ